jgi:hypothetical protein
MSKSFGRANPAESTSTRRDLVRVLGAAQRRSSLKRVANQRDSGQFGEKFIQKINQCAYSVIDQGFVGETKT